MIVPLGIGAYKRTAAFTSEVVCRNCYLEKDASGVSPDETLRIQRPGLTTYETLVPSIRALDYRLGTGERLAVAGQALYANGVAKGAIEGVGLVPMVGTAFVEVLVSGGAVYLYDTTLTTVAMPDGRQVIDVDQLNGYILLLCADGRYYWILPGETTVDPLNFATAESLADDGVALRRVGDEFWIFGTDTVEVWQPTGDVDAPFQRAVGRQYERGCMSRDSVRRFDNTVMWVSNDGQVCRGGPVPQIVSDNGIAERVRKRASSVSAWTFAYDGHEFYALRIPGQGTFAFDALTSLWCEFSTLGMIGWDAHVGYSREGVTYAGSATTGAVWTLDADNGTDAGLAIERIVTGTVGFMGVGPRNDSIAIGVGASEDCIVRVRWKDGQADYPDYYDEIEVRAPMDVATMYRLGQPDQPYRTFEVSCIDPARIRIAGMKANEGWG